MTGPIRLAFIGDIHGNLPALEAVLSDAEAWGAERILDIGDLFGYGPFPNEVVALLRRRSIESILGNYDRKVLRFREKQGKFKKKHPLKFRSFEWTDSALSDEVRRWAAALPKERRVVLGGRRFLLVHARPGSDKEGLMPDTPEAELAEVADASDAEAVVCGHTHAPFVKRVRGVVFINVGSVGRCPGGVAQYARCEVGAGIEATTASVRYDLDALLSAVERSGLPQEFAEYFRSGRELDERD